MSDQSGEIFVGRGCRLEAGRLAGPTVGNSGAKGARDEFPTY